MKNFLFFSGVGLLVIGSWRWLQHALAGDQSAALRASSIFFITGLCALFIGYIYEHFIESRGISKIPTAERKKDVFKLSKEEYVNKYNNGTHASKVNLESEWESENKIKEQM